MSTITLTLELPDDLAELLAGMDEERRQRFAVAALKRQRDEEAPLSHGQRFVQQRREEARQREEKFEQRTLDRRARKAALAQQEAKDTAA